jgi:TetR/AcrR family transcriptional regulator, regulator of cefoperazone and chloramphenicol sensitivity
MTRDLETRARLLAAGERLFADSGFKKVTVRDICRSAKANVAAVNYHFGDKLGLYREVLQAAIDRMRATNEAAREAGDGYDAEERLRRSIVIFVTRLLKNGNDPVHRLIQREIADPTPALDALVEQGIRPRIEYLSRTVAEIIGCPASDPRVLRCVASIQAQSIAYRPHPILARLGIPLEPMTGAQVAAIADHIAEFSLAGIDAIAKRRGRDRGRTHPRHGRRYAHPKSRASRAADGQ